MDESEIQDMEKYGVTRTQETVYHYKKYRYRKLDDAIKFAKNDALTRQGVAQEPAIKSQ